MVEPGPRSGARDNGLRCAGYVVVGDFDPRVADSLLETLRSEGIAAYVLPTTSPRGGYLESKVPTGLTDRLYADAERADQAKQLVDAAGGKDEIDFDSAWKQVLSSLQTPSTAAVPPWPVSEDVDAESHTSTSVPIEAPPNPPVDLPIGGDPALEDHFVPPPPPPIPKFRQATILSLLSILGGVLILVTQFDDGGFDWVGILAILAGGAALIWHMKDGPPNDSGWDDGAVV